MKKSDYQFWCNCEAKELGLKVAFKEVNVNPKHKKTGDCTIRAIANASGKDWKDILTMLYNLSLKNGLMVNDPKNCNSVLEKLGFVKMPQPKKPNGKKYLVGEIDKVCSKEQLKNGVVISLAHHYTCCKNKSIEDLWDCRFKTIGNYWVKKGGN